MYRRCLYLCYRRNASIFPARCPTYAANKAVMVNIAGVTNNCSETNLIQSVMDIPALRTDSLPFRAGLEVSATPCWRLVLDWASEASTKGAVPCGISATSTRWVVRITGRAQLSTTTRPPIHTFPALERACVWSIFPPARPIRLLLSPESVRASSPNNVKDSTLNTT